MSHFCKSFFFFTFLHLFLFIPFYCVIFGHLYKVRVVLLRTKCSWCINTLMLCTPCHLRLILSNTKKIYVSLSLVCTCYWLSRSTKPNHVIAQCVVLLRCLMLIMTELFLACLLSLCLLSIWTLWMSNILSIVVIAHLCFV